MRDDALGASRILIEVCGPGDVSGSRALHWRNGPVLPVRGLVRRADRWSAPASVASLPPQATALYASPKVDAAAATGMPRAVLICRAPSAAMRMSAVDRTLRQVIRPCSGATAQSCRSPRWQ